jgi:hypothetical protein
MKIVIAEILSRAELKPVNGYKAHATRKGIAFTPRDGLPVIAARISLDEYLTILRIKRRACSEIASQANPDSSLRSE